eukprot:556085_1
MATRKRRFKALQHPSAHSHSASSVSEMEPPLKRRRLSAPNLASMNPTQQHHRQSYLSKNLIKLRNDDKVSDVTFVLTQSSIANSSNRNMMSSNRSTTSTSSSLSDDEHPSKVRKYKCIKALFACNSEVFKNLLYGDFNEAQSVHPEIELHDITCRAFEYIRDLFYHLNPVLSHEIVLDVAIAAHRYFIDELMTECINFLRNISNINQWYSIMYDIQSKYRNCFGIETYLSALIDESYLLNNCTQIIFQDNLAQLYALNIDMLSRILQSDNLHLSEELIWHKCIGYALHTTKQRLPSASIPQKIKRLIDAHLTVPKQIYDEIKNNEKKTKEYILSQVIDLSAARSMSKDPWIQKTNIKTWERMIITQRDIFIMNRTQTNKNDTIIIDDDEEERNEEHDEKVTEHAPQDNDERFMSIFVEIMHKLSANIRFTLMAPLFFIKLVQFWNILPSQRVIQIQNYSLCGAKHEMLNTRKREKRYLQYFKDIEVIKRRLRISDSEEQKQENEYEMLRGDNNGVTFYNEEMCFNDAKFNDLSVGDHLDHRDNVGRFATAVIVEIDKHRKKVKLHYIGWQPKWDLWCELDRDSGQQIRFCSAGSISTRQIHRVAFAKKSRDAELKNMMVRCRLALYWYRNHPNVSDYDINEWREATIKRVDKHSGQVQLVVRIEHKDYLWWVHLDCVDEVQTYDANNLTPNTLILA